MSLEQLVKVAELLTFKKDTGSAECIYLRHCPQGVTAIEFVHDENGHHTHNVQKNVQNELNSSGHDS